MIAGAVGFIVFLAGLGWGALWLDSRAQATIRVVATDVVVAKAAENADHLRGITDDVRDLKAHVKSHDEQFDKLNDKLDHIGTTVDTTAGEVQTLIGQRHH
jgi:ABC-type transporter Mla subunit MlaD